MKSIVGSFACAFFFSITLTACKTSTTTDESAVSTDTTAVQATKPVTICMLSEVGVRDGAGESGKYLTTLYLSESVTLTGDSATAIASGKEYMYYKIQLEDGKLGWVRKDFIAKDVLPAVFTASTGINKRPDLASITDKSFSSMDFVATRPAKDNWIEVVGIPTGEKWFIKGYVHADNLTYDPTDVSFAALFKRSSSMNDPAKGSAMMEQLRNNKDLQASQFYTSMFGGEESEHEEGEEEYEQNAPGRHDITQYKLNNGNFSDDANVQTSLTGHGVSPAANRYGDSGQAAEFSGSSYLEGPLFEDYDVATYILWVRSGKKDQTATILGFGNNCFSGYSIILDKSIVSILCGGVRADVTDSSYKLPVDEWVQLVLMKNGDEFSFYANGELQSEGTSTHNALTHQFTLGAGSGCNPEGIGGFFTGTIDDVTIDARYYDASEIREQYANSQR